MTRERIPTTERLARDLEALKDPRLEKMIERARAGEYDDFKTPHPFPQHLLVRDLLRYGYNEMAQQARNGAYDAEGWESDEWAKSDEAEAIFAEVYADEAGLMSKWGLL